LGFAAVGVAATSLEAACPADERIGSFLDIGARNAPWQVSDPWNEISDLAFACEVHGAPIFEKKEAPRL